MKLKLIEGAGIRKAKNQKFKANFRPLKNLKNQKFKVNFRFPERVLKVFHLPKEFLKSGFMRT